MKPKNGADDRALFMYLFLAKLLRHHALANGLLCSRKLETRLPPPALHRSQVVAIEQKPRVFVEQPITNKLVRLKLLHLKRQIHVELRLRIRVSIVHFGTGNTRECFTINGRNSSMKSASIDDFCRCLR